MVGTYSTRLLGFAKLNHQRNMNIRVILQVKNIAEDERGVKKIEKII
jgi:hypothetical protein